MANGVLMLRLQKGFDELETGKKGMKDEGGRLVEQML